MKKFLRRVPLLGPGLAWLRAKLFPPAGPAPFPGSNAFWAERYSTGGNSGVGSYGLFAEFKAEVLNAFVASHQVQSVIEFGCGDGNQLRLARYPDYLGFDVSPGALALCAQLFAGDPHKKFRVLGDYAGEKADLAMSLDVIFHLVEDQVFEPHMRTLFGSARRYVIIYSSDSLEPAGPDSPHVRHRKFTSWVRQNLPQWRLREKVPNRYPYLGDYRTGSFADFFIYEPVPSAGCLGMVVDQFGNCR